MVDFLPLPEKHYSVIYADPPWAYRQCGATAKSRGNAAKHYRTMTTEEISALPVREICGGVSLFSMGHIPQHRGGHQGHGGVGL
jgi:N6-adenosine-specific RNA methylase IME4